MTHVLGLEGRKLIQGYEKLMLVPYRDSKGVVTDGWGHTAAAGGHIPAMGVSITRELADANFDKDVAKFVALVNRLVKVTLNGNQFDALVSFEFNTGELEHSTLLIRLNAGGYASVPHELSKWNHCTIHGVSTVLAGLTNRRNAEIALWEKPV